MTDFRRSLNYVFAQYKAVILAVACALTVAVLFTVSLGTVLPLMKVLMNEEGLTGWVQRGLVKARSGIEFHELSLQEGLADTAPLQVKGLEAELEESGLVEQDMVVGVVDGNGLGPAGKARSAMLAFLATLSGEQTIVLTVEAPGDAALERTVEIDYGAEPIYHAAALWFLERLPDETDEAFRHKSLVLIIVVMLVATILRCILRFCQEYLVKRIGFRTVMQLRLDMYHSVIRMPMSFFSSEGASDPISRFVQDSALVMVGVTTLMGKVIREPFKMIILLALAMQVNARMTLIVLLGAPVAAFVFGKLGRKMKRATRRTLEGWSSMVARLQDSLLGVRVVKGYHCEGFEEKRFGAVCAKLLKQQFRMGKIDSAGPPLIEGLGICAACAAMILAARVMTSGQMPMSEFFQIVVLLGAVAESGRKLGNVHTRLQTADAAATRIFELMDAPVEKDPPNARTLAPLSEGIEFQDLTYTYPDAGEPAVADFNLKIAAGETVAIVGPNGSGKTTLLSLIPRFFLPESGAILIDGVDVAQASLASLRQQIGIVTQKTITFNDTIAANIAYSNPEASREDIVAAAKQAYAHEFIEATPNGYDTIVGEQGATLSGGQLQRLAIARAILRNPALLIFDEATSQIDADSEAKIQEALAEFAQQRTSFIIAHRLSTIIGSDRIVVMDKGRLVDEGKHKDLLERCGLYRQLYEMQFAYEAE